MLLPKKVKHRKWHAPRRNNLGVATRALSLAYGSFGLKAVEPGWVNSRELEAGRRVLTRYVKKGGKIWIRVFPDRPVTKKGNEVPMGGGKGSPDHYVCTIKPGAILFEMEGVPESAAKEALLSAAYKICVKTVYIKKA
ncbi:MAG TPA: 50S ribosomal protein L16 [Candidatus Magasanikbacteria bacterium]|nr:50S ribosomal protein L16 [Candidatus Magasanikbacteria bacterium]